jgi:hypothetical protein
MGARIKKGKKKTRKQKIAESKRCLTCKLERTKPEDIEDLNAMEDEKWLLGITKLKK